MNNHDSGRGPWWTECRSVLVLIACVMVVNVATVNRFPKVWCDEVMDTDPAANLALEGSYVSRAHHFAASDRPFPGFPGYNLGLAAWFQFFGFGRVTSRSYDLAIASFCGLLVWGNAYRRQAPSTPALRLLLVGLVLVMDEFLRTYRGHRYDLSGILLCLAVPLVMTLQRPRFVWWGLALLAFLIPLTAVNAAVFLVLAYGVWFWLDRSVFKLCIPLGIGGVCGTLAYVAWGISTGQWDGIVQNGVTPDVAGGGLAWRWERGLKGLGYAPTSALLAAATPLLWAMGARQSKAAGRWVLLTIGWCVLSPFALAFSGRYQFFYAWISAIPVAHGFVYVADQLHTRASRRVVCLVAMGALSFGLGRATLRAALEWSELDPQPLQQLVERHVNSDDHVLSGAATYYPVKLRAGETYAAPGFPTMTPEQQAEVNLIIVSEVENGAGSDAMSPLLARFPGEWKRVERLSVSRGEWRTKLGWSPRSSFVYDVHVYRREEGTAGENTVQ